MSIMYFGHISISTKNNKKGRVKKFFFFFFFQTFLFPVVFYIFRLKFWTFEFIIKMGSDKITFYDWKFLDLSQFLNGINWSGMTFNSWLPFDIVLSTKEWRQLPMLVRISSFEWVETSKWLITKPKLFHSFFSTKNPQKPLDFIQHLIFLFLF